MARRKYTGFTDEFVKRPQLNLKTETRKGVAVVFFIVLVIVFALSLNGNAGPFGEVLSKVLRLAFGWMAYGVLVVFLFIIISLLKNREQSESDSVSTHPYVGGVLLTIALTGLMHLFVIRNDINQAFELVKVGRGGGYLGVLTSYPLLNFTSFAAALVILIGGVLISIFITFDSFNFFLRKNKIGKQEEKLKAAPFKINNQVTGFVKEAVPEVNPRLREDKIEKPVVHGLDEIKVSKKPKVQPSDQNWKFPSLDLLDDSKTRVDSGNIEMNVAIIQKTLNDFGIEVEMGEVNVGPTVTQYTLRPAVGVKLSQIGALQNDLALALAASSVRMELPIPGKALVGVEIPNKTTATVRIKEILGHPGFVEHPSKLAFALGRDVAGHPMVSDLAKMPHLLIAGATGTGKSVGINSLLISLLYRSTPNEVKLIVIDPKRVELPLYNGIPHLLTKVIIDHQQAVNALKWVVSEMDRRYKLLSEVHKRNIGEYNQSSLLKLPYLVVVIDELADLMSVAQNDVEAAIVRLAQMARAVGIHLVVATQRPSVDVITGLIKANITARAAFAVASQVDSRTILDMAGAEKLLGSGDMLYVTAELSKPKRVQGTFVGEKEIKKVTDYLRAQGSPAEYDERIVEKPKHDFSRQSEEDFDEDDELIPVAIETVRNAGKASASLLQRRLRVGYARAARLLDILEERGIIGPAEGAKPRDVYDADSTEDES
ncbi:MAG: DNA translocase FtsK 4TM domain-containing protein [Candidatus Doudnabacteria bacterium]|nr:DNA translocase FtsK 4TM domain-containing protein [Candidatus Doudnabacteria bacterium]